ncbi:MAG: hypothetical protein JWS12_36 [Candidatus Saccharibacteria bacterium]|nr:hypothetical protein [Candidatus Saccharibacteria bacterium]
MKVLILYRPLSEQRRPVEEFIHEFERQHPDRKLKTMDIDSRDGMAMATLYDIVRYPAVLATSDEGELLNSWEGDQLPLMNEVLAYA